MTWVIASDHGGAPLIEPLLEFLQEKGAYVAVLRDLDALEEKTNYVDDADALVRFILDGEATYGILLCGTGIGVSMRANRYKNVRAALVHDEFTAQMAKEHNNANVLCMGARVLTAEQAVSCLRTFYEAEFEGGRHLDRVKKLDK